MKHNHYDVMPPGFLRDCSILDIGCGDLSAQHDSIHADHMFDDYVGIDYPQDVREWEPERLFDRILMMHMLEYVPLQDWGRLFDRIRSWLKEGGVLVVVVAYRVSVQDTFNLHHQTFEIDERLLRPFVPGVVFGTYWDITPFDSPNVGVKEWISSVLHRHKRVRRYLRGTLKLVAVWHKEAAR